MRAKGKGAAIIFSALMILLLASAQNAKGELKLDLSLDNATFLLEEPLAGMVVFTNTGSEPIRLITDVSVGLLSFWISYEKGEKWKYMPLLVAEIIVDENTWTRLAPGQSFSQQVIFDSWDWKRHPTGAYSIEADYQGTKSNTVTFTLVEPQGIDKEAYGLLKVCIPKSGPTTPWFIPADDKWKSLEKILLLYPQSTYAKYAQYGYAMRFYVDRNDERAIAEFQKIVDNYPHFCYTDEAQSWIGKTYRRKGDTQSAKKVFEQMLLNARSDDMKQRAEEMLVRIHATK